LKVMNAYHFVMSTEELSTMHGPVGICRPVIYLKDCKKLIAK